MASPPSLADVVALMDRWYPPATADSWDAPGLVCGDPAADVRRILLAVDPVATVVDEALGTGADLLVAHHPLLLKAVHGVAATTPKGRIVHALTTGGCALLTAHTNADAPAGGVSDSLALALGLVAAVPLEPRAALELDKIVVFAPRDAADKLRTALAEAGAGALGDYEASSFTAVGEGRFRPLDGARPAIGTVGMDEVVDEVRLEVVLPRALRAPVLAAVLAVHPYEEVPIDVIELAARPDLTSGSGRIGRLERPVPLAEFADRVARTLPATAHGVRVAGDPDRVVETVALCGGAGDFLLDQARQAGADVYLTSDLRHHPASEFREQAGASGPALVDVAHWAAEWTWLPVLARRLREELGDSVEVQVSTRCTDPWTFRADAPTTTPGEPR